MLVKLDSTPHHLARQPGYRPEVDGLRALAVVPVILFHAGFSAFAGGYVGVDVFFVISGYLITSIILKEKRSGTFSIANFYERRARRILPALFFVILLCLPVAWFCMMPRQLEDFSVSLAAVALFASNVWFARTSGYFDLTAEQKPLLHTWSLGVEEQYYALFPLLVVLLWRFGRRTLAWVTAAVALASLAWSQWGWPNDAPARFYLAPSRAWELLLGCLLAYATLERPLHERVSIVVANTLAALGLLLIAAAVAFYDDATPFPGLYALAPTLGSVLIIGFAANTTAVGRWLASPWLVGLGLISYSAYLWHQPLFAFARLSSLGEPPDLVLVALSLATLPLAYLTWRYVEQPVRQRRLLSRRRVFVYGAVASLVALTIGLVGNSQRGFATRLTQEQLNRYQRITQAVDSNRLFFTGGCKYAAPENLDAAFQRRFEQCYRRAGRAVWVFGDSHATDLYNAFVVHGQRAHLVLLSKGCPRRDSQQACFAAAVDFIKRHRQQIAVVFYTRKGRHFLRNRRSPPLDEHYLRSTQGLLRDLAAALPVVWLGPQAEPGIDLRSINVLLGRGQPVDERREHRGIAMLDDTLVEMNRNQPFRYVSKLKLVDFDFYRDFFVSGQYTYADSNHWSTFGERYFGARLMDDALIASYLLNR